MKPRREEAEVPLSPVAGMLPEGKKWFSSKEAASVIGRSPQYVRDCFDNQKIMGHALNARGRTGDEKRKSYQIPRAALLLYLMETANYQGGDFAERILNLAGQLAPGERRALAEKLRGNPRSIWAE